MRSIVLAALVALSLASLPEVSFSDPVPEERCCVCGDCPVLNGTARLQGVPSTGPFLCSEVSSIDECTNFCQSSGCASSAANLGSCNVGDSATVCGNGDVMAPAASSLGLLLLAAALSGAGAFLLRRQRPA